MQDIALVLLAVDVVFKQTPNFENKNGLGAGGPVDDGNGNVVYETYSTIKEVPNYFGRVKEVIR